MSSSFCAFLQAEPIRCRYMQHLLLLGASPKVEPIAWQGAIEVVGEDGQGTNLGTLKVHEGDDVTAVVYYHAYTLSHAAPLTPAQLDQLLQGTFTRPQHT